MLADLLRGQFGDDRLEIRAVVVAGPQQGSDGVDDLLPTAVADGDVDAHSAVGVRGHCLEPGAQVRRHDFEIADQLHSDAVEGGDLLHQVGDDLDEDRDLFGRPCEVLLGQDVESDDLDVDLEAPAEELDDLRRPRPVPVGGGRPELPGPPPIAVGDDSDVAGNRHRLVELAFESSLVQPIEQVHRSGHSCLLSR